MDDSIPSISTGTVGSRFVSSNDIETAKARRDEQWKAAYARQDTSFPIHTARSWSDSVCTSRLGQEPPPQPVEDSFDGRSLAEVSGFDNVLNRVDRERH
jgi:hypothetical protein